jgi:hypothetical protein
MNVALLLKWSGGFLEMTAVYATVGEGQISEGPLAYGM